MNALAAKELHLLLDSAGALIVYQEEGTHWAGVLGFSSEERAREFVAASHLDAAETAAIEICPVSGAAGGGGAATLELGPKPIVTLAMTAAIPTTKQISANTFLPRSRG